MDALGDKRVSDMIIRAIMKMFSLSRLVKPKPPKPFKDMFLDRQISMNRKSQNR